MLGDGSGEIGGNRQEAAGAEGFAAAHEALKADSSIQFQLPRAPPEPEPPTWLRDLLQWLGEALRPVGRFLNWIGSFFPDAPYARMFLWTVLALAAATLLYLTYARLRYGEWRLPRRSRAQLLEANQQEEQWQPEEGTARSWLREADALAAGGRYAEAVHHLLFRSVEDIARRRPRLVRPSLTSRELAGSPSLPTAARELFASIASLVERSLFGGRHVGEVDWTLARTAYSDLVLPGSWRA